MTKRKTVSLAAATDRELSKIEYDNASYGHFWLLRDLGGDVNIADQKLGEVVRQSIVIPRRAFNELIKRYLKEQKVRP